MANKLPWDNNWNRTYRITLGVREYTKTEIISEVIVFDAKLKVGTTTPTETSSSVIPSDAIAMDNLTDPRGFTFRFETQAVASSSGGSSEKSNLVLYNLSDEAKRILLQPNCIVIIEAGYEGKLTLCYTGDVLNVTPMKNPPDTSYKIKLVAEGNAQRNEVINTHYDEGLSAKAVIEHMALNFTGTSLATYGLNDYTDKYKTGGMAFTGSLIDNFNALIKKMNLEYHFSNNKIYIIPYRIKGKDYEDFARTNYTLSEDSIKNVADTSDHSGKSSDDTQNKIKKLQINTYYIPVEIGQFITIPTAKALKGYSGTYIVKGRRVILESKGNAWDVVLEVEELSQ